MRASHKIKFQPRQAMAFTTRATELLFGGASEGGKSAMLRRAFKLWALTIPHLQLFLFRRRYAEVMQNHMEGKDGFRQLLQPEIAAKTVTIAGNEIKFTNGSRIILAQMNHRDDLQKYEGLEKHVLGIDEATRIKPEYINALTGWVRMPEDMIALLPDQIRPLYPWMSDEELQQMFPRIIYTGNPIGAAKNYFRREFVKAIPNEQIKKVGAFYRQFIPSFVGDNVYADPVAQRERLARMGEAVADALITGSWDSLTGNYFLEFSEKMHMTDSFLPPPGWFLFRTFDWGSAEPFAVLWWCVSDGNEFRDATGATRWFPRGALIAYREWYGCDKTNPARGLRMRNEAVADGIIARTHEKHTGITVTDSLPFQDRGMSKGSQEYKIADVFAARGCPLVRGNCARIHGWAQVRDRLIGIDGLPLLYFTYDCPRCAEYLPAIDRHETREEDAEESGEPTHICDCIRLAATTRPIVRESDEAKTARREKTCQISKIPTSLTPLQIVQRLRYGKFTN